MLVYALHVADATGDQGEVVLEAGRRPSTFQVAVPRSTNVPVVLLSWTWIVLFVSVSSAKVTGLAVLLADPPPLRVQVAVAVLVPPV